MKKLLLAALLSGVAVPALAADLPVKAPRVAPVGDWTGFYLGIHGGYGWAKFEPEIDIDPFSDPKAKGFVIGGHAGYLWQYGRFVGGLEIAYSHASMKDDQSFSETFGCGEGRCTETLSLDVKMQALASAHARAGILVSNDILLYGLGGLGYGRSKANVTFSISCAPNCGSESISFNANEHHFGPVAGAGFEWRLAQNLSLGVEGKYYWFGTQNYTFTSPSVPGLPLATKADVNAITVEGRVNLRF